MIPVNCTDCGRLLDPPDGSYVHWETYHLGHDLEARRAKGQCHDEGEEERSVDETALQDDAHDGGQLVFCTVEVERACSCPVYVPDTAREKCCEMLSVTMPLRCAHMDE